MGIEQVQAYRIGDGKCFGGIEEARGNEIMHLLEMLPDKEPFRGKLTPSMYPQSKKDLRKLVGLVRTWLMNAEASLAQMSMDEGKKE